jgi:NitT/TauT family transport system ATP-binding protein
VIGGKDEGPTSTTQAPLQQLPVTISGVTKSYLTRTGDVEALAGVDLAVWPGEFVALIGPSGCGKSTLLHIVAGLETQSAGTVLVNGQAARPGNRDVGIMLQKAVLFPWRTVLQNVLLPAEVQRREAATARRRAHELLETMGLADFMDKHPWELSGGMKQRVSLAQALVTDPELLLMDEPFSAVDEFTRERLNVELSSLHDAMGRTTVYVTHNIQEAVFLADRVVVMQPRPGRIAEIVAIDLPRPRVPEMMQQPRTHELVDHIRSLVWRSA